MQLIIDRFEGSFAVCEKEDKLFTNIPKYKLPLESKEGDCLIQGTDGIFRIDTDLTKEREKRIRNKMDNLFE